MKRIGIIIGVLLLIALVGAAGWYFVSPLFINKTINEALPFAPAETPEYPDEDEIGAILPPTAVVTGEVASEEVSSEETPATETVTESVATTVTPTVTTTTAVEQTQTNAPLVLGQGHFVDGDSFHKGSGVATIYATPDGGYLLRLDDFAATNGPDLHVLLSPNAMPTDHASLGEFLDLGLLKGNIGDQNYELPADFDPTLYKSVVIHCVAFQVIFATATLE
jgi:hypothetical protein